MTQPHPAHSDQIDDLVATGKAIYNRIQALHQEASDLDVALHNILQKIDNQLDETLSSDPSVQEMYSYLHKILSSDELY